MATDADLHRIATALPHVESGTFWGGPAYVVAGKAIVNRRAPRADEGAVDPSTGEPYTDLVVVHLGSWEDRDEVLSTFDPEVVFTIPHFRRAKAVLAHLDLVTPEALEDLLDIAWRGRTPRRLQEPRHEGAGRGEDQ
jgi:hypothetical protein